MWRRCTARCTCPNYGVFDEQRYFQSGSEAVIFELNGIPIGLSVCEDIWEPGPAGDARRRWPAPSCW